MAPLSREKRTAGRLQPEVTECHVMFSEATATTPGWKGSAAVAGSVPFATKYSCTPGAGFEVGDVEGEGGAVVGVSDGVGMGVSDGVGIGVSDGAAVVASEGPDVVAAPARAVLSVATATEPTAALPNMTTKPTAARSRIRLCGFAAAEFIFVALPRCALPPWPTQ